MKGIRRYPFLWLHIIKIIKQVMNLYISALIVREYVRR